MTRTYGRSPIGTRLIEKVPSGRWQTTTFLGALRIDGFVAPLTVDGAINGPLKRAATCIFNTPNRSVSHMD